MSLDFDNAETPEEAYWRKLPEERILGYWRCLIEIFICEKITILYIPKYANLLVTVAKHINREISGKLIYDTIICLNCG